MHYCIITLLFVQDCSRSYPIRLHKLILRLFPNYLFHRFLYSFTPFLILSVVTHTYTTNSIVLRALQIRTSPLWRSSSWAHSMASKSSVWTMNSTRHAPPVSISSPAAPPALLAAAAAASIHRRLALQSLHHHRAVGALHISQNSFRTCKHMYKSHKCLIS